MKYEIKNRWTGDVIFSAETKNFKLAVKMAVEQKINLSNSNLSNSNLSGSDLSGSNLSGSDLRSSDLSNSNFRGSNFRGSDLSGSDLRSSDLSGSDLRSSDLSNSNLRNSDLRDSDLRNSNLGNSNLSGSNLSDSDLSGSKTDKRYIQVACIGSEKRMTTYCFEDDKIWCGCFSGTLKEFEEQVKEKHKDNEQYLNEYMGFIEYINKLKK